MSSRSDFIVRRAEPRDAEAIVSLVDALASFVNDPPTHLTADDIRRDGFGPDAWFTCYVAEHDNKVVGYAMVYPAYSTDLGGRGLYMADLFVEEALRGRGVGRALIVAAARYAGEIGAVWMRWDVWVENATAEAFYRAIGATVYDEIKDMVLRGDALAALAATKR